MSNANYPLWYGLPRGVELRADGRPAAQAQASGGFRLPWSIQFCGWLIPMLFGLGVLGAYYELTTAHPVAEELRTRFLATDEGMRLLQSGVADYLLPTGAALLLVGLYLALRTGFLRHLDETDPITKIIAFIYLAPGVTFVLVVGGAIAVMAGLMLLYVALFFIIGAAMLLGALFSAGS